MCGGVTTCAPQVRYVIDFYNAVPQPGQPIAMHLDVRPALDSAQVRGWLPRCAARRCTCGACPSQMPAPPTFCPKLDPHCLARPPEYHRRQAALSEHGACGIQALFDRIRMQLKWTTSGRWLGETTQTASVAGGERESS